MSNMQDQDNDHNNGTQRRGRGAPPNQFIIPGRFRQSKISNQEILEFYLNMGFLSLSFRIPIGNSDRVPVYIRYFINPPNVDVRSLREGRHDDGEWEDGDEEEYEDSRRG